MSNPFQKVAHGVEVAAMDVIHAAETVLSVGSKVIKVVEDAKALTPEFKSALALLVNDAKALAAPLAPVVATGGQNMIVDAAALMPVAADVVKLVKDFFAFLPALESALKKLGEDVK